MYKYYIHLCISYWSHSECYFLLPTFREARFQRERKVTETRLRLNGKTIGRSGRFVSHVCRSRCSYYIILWSYYDHIMIWYDMIWFSMFPIYVRPSTCRPFFTCLKGSLVKNYTGVGSVQRHQRHLNWWWLPEPLAMISTPRSRAESWLWVKREDSCNVRPPSDVCWLTKAPVTIVICVP